MKKVIDIQINLSEPFKEVATAVLCIIIEHRAASMERRVGGKIIPEKFVLNTTLDNEPMSFTHTLASKEELLKRLPELEEMAIKAAKQRLTELTTQSFEQQLSKLGYE